MLHFASFTFLISLLSPCSSSAACPPPPITTIGLTYCPSDPVPSSLHQNMLPFMLVTPSNTLNLLCPLEFFPFGFKCPLAVPMLKKHLWTYRSFTSFLKPFSGISSVSIFTAFQDQLVSQKRRIFHSEGKILQSVPYRLSSEKSLKRSVMLDEGIKWWLFEICPDTKM